MRDPFLDDDLTGEFGDVGRSPSFVSGWWIIPALFFGVALIASVYALLT